MDPLALLRAFCDTSLDDRLAAHRAVDPALGALAVFRRAAERVPAYRAFLAEARVDPDSITDLARVPVVTKDSYLRAHPLADLCLDGAIVPSDTIALSSGSTGMATYFPRGLRHEIEVAWRFEQVFRDSFRAHERRTLAVVCFPLGTWVGGMFTTACCRLLALKGYPLLVVSAGNQPPEILRAVRELGPEFEQVVLLGYPPFLKDVIDGGVADGLRWAEHDIHLVMAGEMFSEAWRDIMRERAGMRELLHGSASLYGTADAGVLGNETPLSVAIRRFADARPEVSEALFGSRRPPTLVQYDPVDRFFEHDGDALMFTGEGGGIPLVRYAIGDTGGVVPFATMLERLAEFGFRKPEELRELPFVYLFGRSMHAVSFYGANVFAEAVRIGLEDERVRAQVSGKFVMQVVEDEDKNRELALDVELARGAEPAAELAARVADCVRDELVCASSEFSAYVPHERQTPSVRLWSHAHPQHFPQGVKHRYVRICT